MNAKGGSRLRTSLHYASLHDHVEVAVVLLEAGANEFARDSGGYTPLNLSMGGKMCKLLHKVCTYICTGLLYFSGCLREIGKDTKPIVKCIHPVDKVP